MNGRPAGLSSDSDSDFCFEYESEYKTSKTKHYTKSRDYLNKIKSEPKLDCIGPKITVNSEGSINQENDLSEGNENCQSLSLTTGNEYLCRSPSRSIQSSPVPWRKGESPNGPFHSLDELRMAVVQGNLPVVKGFLSNGVGVDQILKSGWTALMFASSSARVDIVLHLLHQGANVNIHKEMFTALMAACASSQESESDLLECINHLIDFGAQAEACERHRMTPLMFASKEGRVDIVQRLLKENINVDKQDNKGWTALCWAATKGHGRVVRMLLQHSADPSSTNIHGQTPSDIAMAAGYFEVAEILQKDFSNNLTVDNSTSLPRHCSIKKSCSLSNLSKRTLCLSTCGEMDMVLTGLELTHYTELFRKNKINLECFLRLNEEDLIRLGIDELGSRKKLLQARVDIHKQEWKTGSLPNMMELDLISMPDAVAMVKNINKHLRYVHASIGYLRDQIQNTPRILEIGQEKHNVSSLSNCFSESLKNLSHLGDEVFFFKAHLDTVRDNADFSPVDTIAAKRDDGRRWQKRLLISLVATTSVMSVVYFWKPKIFSSIFSLNYYPQPPVFLDIN